MKKAISVILTLLLLLAVLPVGADAAGSLDNFRKVNTYTDGRFSDVKTNHWFYENVAYAYELGLIKGSSGTGYNPNGYVKYSEALAFACRLHSIYNGGTGDFKQGDPWYQVYVDYAEEEGIIRPGFITDINAPASRVDFAALMAAALPPEALKPINVIEYVPDVDYTYTDGGAVLRLYQAGILTGSDDACNFYPDNNIKRSEVATIISRMATPDMRKHIVLLSPYSPELVITPTEKAVTITDGQPVTVKFKMPGGAITAVHTPGSGNIAAVKSAQWEGDDYILTIAPVANGVSVINVGIKEAPEIFASLTVKVTGMPQENNGNLTLSASNIMISGITAINVHSNGGAATRWEYDDTVISVESGPWEGDTDHALYIVPLAVGETTLKVWQVNDPASASEVTVRVVGVNGVSAWAPSTITGGDRILVYSPDGEAVSWQSYSGCVSLSAGKWSEHYNIYTINLSPISQGTGLINISLAETPWISTFLNVTVASPLPRLSTFSDNVTVDGTATVYIHVSDMDFEFIYPENDDYKKLVTLEVGQWDGYALPLTFTALGTGACDLTLTLDNDPATALTLHLEVKK